MRLFELTISTHVGDHVPLPRTFEDWLRAMFGDEAVDHMPAGCATLESVVERRYPLADDVIDRRIELGALRGPSYR